MTVIVKYISDETEYNFNRIEEITNPEDVIYINCSKNKLIYLPENMNFPLLTDFDCAYNQLLSLPENMNFPLLQKFYCYGNNLVSLPENMDFPSLIHFDCNNNKLISLPENMNFPSLIHFDCNNNKLISLPENMNFPLLQKFYCYGKNLTSLPETMNFPNLREFNCNGNNLTSLPENMNFPQLKVFYFSYNKLVSLPENMNTMFPQLEVFYCNCNNLVSLPENMNFPLLQKFYCYDNNLTSLPENMNFPNLREFYCGNNKLSSLPENMNFPLLERFYCSNNKLVSLPVCIMNWNNLQHICYFNNEIELPPQLERFLNRIRQGSINKINVYGDTQNVHNSSIQGSVRDSINRLTTRRDLHKFDSARLNTMILTDDVLLPKVKEQLIEYCQDDSVHSLLLLKFSEVLWYVLNTVTHDFSNDISVQTEIKRVLNQEMQDAECKCFTGRMNRVVNCLNGFSPLVEVKISDGEQIGNIIVMLRDKALDTEGNYSVEKHRQLVSTALQERDYDSDTVSQWLKYIE